MSRIGNASLTISKDVTLTIEGDTVLVKGTKGTITVPVPKQVSIVQDGETVRVERKHNDKTSKALHGYMRAVLSNAIIGVTKGWTKTLELSGVGYRANLSGANLTGANLFGANLQNANLTGANLLNANLQNANLTGAVLTKAKMPDGKIQD